MKPPRPGEAVWPTPVPDVLPEDVENVLELEAALRDGALPDRALVPRGGNCDHRSCRHHGQGCRMYTAESIEPSAEDREIAARLVADGWHSTSSKHRHLARWKVAPPAPEDLLRADVPEPHRATALRMLRDFPRCELGLQAQRLTRALACRRLGRTDAEDPDTLPVEECTLTFKQFRAFKQAGGPSA